MSSKKWVLVFLVTVFVLAALLAGLNLAADPFGAFGDRLLHWFSYDETNNPRVAKLSYLASRGIRFLYPRLLVDQLVPGGRVQRAV